MSEGVSAPCVLGGSGYPRCGGGERYAPPKNAMRLAWMLRAFAERPHAPDRQRSEAVRTSSPTSMDSRGAIESNAFDTINDPLLRLNPYIPR